MRLPDFTDDAGLIALRRSMGADTPGSFSPSYQPERLTLAELEQLATDGKDVSIGPLLCLRTAPSATKTPVFLCIFATSHKTGGVSGYLDSTWQTAEPYNSSDSETVSTTTSWPHAMMDSFKLI